MRGWRILLKERAPQSTDVKTRSMLSPANSLLKISSRQLHGGEHENATVSERPGPALRDPCRGLTHFEIVKAAADRSLKVI